MKKTIMSLILLLNQDIKNHFPPIILILIIMLMMNTINIIIFLQIYKLQKNFIIFFLAKKVMNIKKLIFFFLLENNSLNQSSEETFKWQINKGYSEKGGIIGFGKETPKKGGALFAKFKNEENIKPFEPPFFSVNSPNFEVKKTIKIIKNIIIIKKKGFTQNQDSLLFSSPNQLPVKLKEN